MVGQSQKKIDENIIEQLGFEKEPTTPEEAAEAERKAIFAKARDAFLQYYDLADKEEVWQVGDKVCHKELEDLLRYVMPESIKLLHSGMQDLYQLTLKINSKESAEQYASAIHLHLDILNQQCGEILYVWTAYEKESKWIEYDREMHKMLADISVIYSQIKKQLTQGYDNPMYWGTDKLIMKQKREWLEIMVLKGGFSHQMRYRNRRR